MERNYDEVISDRLIQLAAIESALEKQNKRMESFDKRMELSIRRMVRAESRLEQHEKGMETLNANMKVLNVKLEQSIKDQREFSQMQYSRSKRCT